MAFPYRDDEAPEIRVTVRKILSESEKAFRLEKVHGGGFTILKKKDFDVIDHGNFRDSNRTVCREVYCFPNDKHARIAELTAEMQKVLKAYADDFTKSSERWAKLTT